MELKQIKMSDIVPDENNPREDFGDLHALARTFEGNAYAPGQPYNAIVVVMDGSIYRIADGERRYRAMKLNGVEECNAVVCGDYEEAESMIAMLASDAKEPLTEVEKSKAVQRALLLGVAPQVVESTGRLKRGQAKKIASFMEKGMAIQATIDQMLEAYALRDKGASEDAVQRVLAADEEDWNTVASSVRHDMKVEAFRKDASAVLAEAGFVFDDERPQDVPYCRMFSSVEDLSKVLFEELPEDTCFWVSSYPLAVEMFGSAEGNAFSSVEPNEELDIAKAAIRAGVSARAAWYADALKTDRAGKRIRATPHVDAYLIEEASKSLSAERFREKASSQPPTKQPVTLFGSCAEVIYQYYNYELDPFDARVMIGDEVVFELEEKLKWIEACILDGFILEPTEEEIVEKMRAFRGEIASEESDATEDLSGQVDGESVTIGSYTPLSDLIPGDTFNPLEGKPSEKDDGIDLSKIALDGMAVA